MQLLNAPVFRYSIRFRAIQHLSLPGYIIAIIKIAIDILLSEFDTYDMLNSVY